jgi:NADH-quinone oxidoreductase subunit D
MTLSKDELTHVTGIGSDEKTVETSLDELRGLVSPAAFTGETMLLNMGPQHPSTHGVLRLMLELDGENVVNVLPDVGYLHTGIEKSLESKSYEKSLVMTDRIDYLNNQGNNLAYCLAIEKLCEIDVPLRAQYLRVIVAELQRLNSHLVWLGTHILDLGATSVFLYCLREREYILEMFEMISGQRMMGNINRPGGIWRDVTPDFVKALKKFLKYLPGKIDDYEAIVTQNPIFVDRTKDIGFISAEDAINWSVTGPYLRGSGVNLDWRKAAPYSSYDHFDFDVPLGTNGDVYDRYMCRVQEMRESLKIIQQAFDGLPQGPYRTTNRKFAPPPRAELGTSMEALIHHFKLWTEGFKAPVGEVYIRTESPRGELGIYMAGDGTSRPHRVRFRTPSFINLQSIGVPGTGVLVADLVAIIGSIDIVLGDCDR